MSATRDPDRIFRAWLEQMPSEAPDRAIAAVLQATEAAPQLRAWPRVGRWRPHQVNRLSLIAAVAVSALALVGGAVLLTAGPPGPSTAVPTTSPTTASIPTSAATVTTPVALRATWVASTGAGAGSLARLVIEPARISVQSFVGQPVAGATDELTFAATSGPGCRPGDVGRYRFGLSPDGRVPNSDGTRLGLTAIADACLARQAVLQREWVRAIDVDNVGGRGVAVNFDPMIMVTLPPKTYGAQAGVDGLTLDAADGAAFVATRNPWGWSEPCSETGGSKVELAPTAEAFIHYAQTLPGTGGGQEVAEIDGRPAVHLTLTTTFDAGCKAAGVAGQLFEWTTGDPANTGGWFIQQGETDSIYLVEVDGNLFPLQWLGPDVTQADELAVLSTVRFVNTLAGF